MHSPVIALGSDSRLRLVCSAAPDFDAWWRRACLSTWPARGGHIQAAEPHTWNRRLPHTMLTHCRAPTPPPTSTREAQLAVSPRPAPCTTPAAQHERAGNTTSLDRCWVGHVKIVSSTVDWQTHHARTSTLKAPSERRNVQSMRAVVHAPGARCQSSAAASFTRSGCAGASPRRQCCAASPPPSRQQARC